MSPPPERISDRLQHIDSIRGIAALGVIYLHTAQALVLRAAGKVSETEQLIFYSLLHVVDVGKISVILFFAISGFVIPGVLLNSDSPRPVLGFVINRLFRVYPAYWLSILVAVALALSLHSSSVNFRLVAVNLTLLQQFIGVPNLLGIYWTLQIELIFYAMCIILFLMHALGKPRRVLLTLIAMLAVAFLMAKIAAWYHHKMPLALPLSLAVMLFGLLWRKALIDGGNDKLPVVVASAALLIAVPVICSVGYAPGLADEGYSASTYIFSYAVAVLSFVTLTTWIKIRSRITSFLGRISYSVYLFGPIAGLALEAVAPPARMWLPIAHIYILAVMLLAIVIAAVVYRFIEAPSIALGRRIANRFCLGSRNADRSAETM